MRSIAEIEVERQELHKQEKAIQVEIRQKESSLSKAKEENLQLLKRYVGIAKKPASLLVQAEKLRRLEIELQQLRDMLPLIGERFTELESEERVVEASQKLDAYREKETKFFEKLEQTMGMLEEAGKLGERLLAIVGQLHTENPLYDLSPCFSGLSYAEFEQLKMPNVGRYQFLTKSVQLERALEPIMKAGKQFSDLGFSIENNGLRHIRYPEKPVGPVAASQNSNPRGYVVEDGWKARQFNKNAAIA